MLRTTADFVKHNQHNASDEKRTAFVAPLDIERVAQSFIHLGGKFCF
jgi:hypothetical protein